MTDGQNFPGSVPPQFTLQGFGAGPVNESAYAQPTAYRPPSPVSHAGQMAALPALPVPGKRGRTVSVWLFGILGFMLIGLVGYFGSVIGPSASIIGLLLALVPLAIVLFGVYLIDKWEPEPRSVMAFALAWGAIASVGLTLLVDLGLTLLVGPRPAEFTIVIQAPVVEEVFKGLGVFLIFVVARRAFDGPVDGVVYGALVGAGFAFTENIQYFAISLIEGGRDQLGATFVARALMSPFAHAMFTALIGLAIGMAARRSSSVAGAFGSGLAGLVGAILLHALWNGSAVFGNFFLLYVLLQIPLFVGFIIGVILLRRQEERLTRLRLGDYAAAGWLTPEEVNMLATPQGRRVGLAWARTLRGDRRPLMRSFVKDATQLAALRQRAITGRDSYAQEDERTLLVRMRATRAALLAY